MWLTTGRITPVKPSNIAPRPKTPRLKAISGVHPEVDVALVSRSIHALEDETVADLIDLLYRNSEAVRKELSHKLPGAERAKTAKLQVTSRKKCDAADRSVQLVVDEICAVSEEASEQAALVRELQSQCQEGERALWTAERALHQCNLDNHAMRDEIKRCLHAAGKPQMAFTYTPDLSDPQGPSKYAAVATRPHSRNNRMTIVEFEEEAA
jgi:hypothetical protein